MLLSDGCFTLLRADPNACVLLQHGDGKAGHGGLGQLALLHMGEHELFDTAGRGPQQVWCSAATEAG